MADIEDADNIGDPGPEIRSQLVLGAIGIPFLVAGAILSTLASLAVWFNDYRWMYFWLGMLANDAGYIGVPLLLVGKIAILQRNGSRRGWIFIAIFGIGWIWSYILVYVIVPATPFTAFWMVEVLEYAVSYSFFFFSLYAWWSIQSVVSNRASFLSYLILSGVEPVLVRIILFLLSLFGSSSIRTPLDVLPFLLSGLFGSILVDVVFILFYIGQLRASKSEGYVEHCSVFEHWVKIP